MFKFPGFIKLKLPDHCCVSKGSAVTDPHAVIAHESLNRAQLSAADNSVRELGIPVRLKCTVTTDLRSLYQAIEYVSYEPCKLIETVRHGENCEMTLKIGDISVIRKVCGVLKDLTGCKVEGEINTPTTKIMLQY